MGLAQRHNYPVEKMHIQYDSINMRLRSRMSTSLHEDFTNDFD